MAKQSFETWLKDKGRKRWAVVLLGISQSYFEEKILPRVKAELRASRVVKIQSEKEWKEKKNEITRPSLFGEVTLVLLGGVTEKTAEEILSVIKSFSYLYALYFSPNRLRGKFWQNFDQLLISDEGRSWDNFLRTILKEQGIRMSKPAWFKIQRLWQELDLSWEELEQFFRLFPEGEEVTLEEVNAFFERREKGLLFPFLDAVGERRLELANHYLFSLLDIGFSPSLILVHLGRKFRLILQVQETKEDKIDLWQNRKLSPFEMEQKIKKQAQNFSLPEVRNIFHFLHQTDRILKTQRCDPKAIFLDLISQIIVSPLEEPHLLRKPYEDGGTDEI